MQGGKEEEEKVDAGSGNGGRGRGGVGETCTSEPPALVRLCLFHVPTAFIEPSRAAECTDSPTRERAHSHRQRQAM